MSFVTDGDTEDLGTGYLRRPISVAQLLEREGYRPVVRSRTARRALSGVAAGAVLTLGAVVGSLFLNHGERTTGDIATGALGQSGGDIVLAESNTPAGNTPAASATVSTPAPHATTHPQRTTPSAATRPTRQHTSTGHSATPHHTNPAPATTKPATTESTPAATTPDTTPATSSSHNTQTTQSPPAATQTAPTSDSTAQGSTTDQTTPSTTTQQDNGGLLGGVGQVLGSVTQPVFNWFG